MDRYCASRAHQLAEALHHSPHGDALIRLGLAGGLVEVVAQVGGRLLRCLRLSLALRLAVRFRVVVVYVAVLLVLICLGLFVALLMLFLLAVSLGILVGAIWMLGN